MLFLANSTLSSAICAQIAVREGERGVHTAEPLAILHSTNWPLLRAPRTVRSLFLLSETYAIIILQPSVQSTSLRSGCPTFL